MARRLPLLLLLALPVLGACDAMDPYNRAGGWRPTAANEANLRSMVVQPADLAEGRGTTTAVGQNASSAIDRLRGDRLRSLPEQNVTPSLGASSGAR
jgi:hypothetical protein